VTTAFGTESQSLVSSQLSMLPDCGIRLSVRVQVVEGRWAHLCTLAA